MDYPRPEKRWTERERSPVKDRLAPRPLMAIKVDRPTKSRSPTGKRNDYDGKISSCLMHVITAGTKLKLKKNYDCIEKGIFIVVMLI